VLQAGRQLEAAVETGAAPSPSPAMVDPQSDSDSPASENSVEAARRLTALSVSEVRRLTVRDPGPPPSERVSVVTAPFTRSVGARTMSIRQAEMQLAKDSDSSDSEPRPDLERRLTMLSASETRRLTVQTATAEPGRGDPRRSTLFDGEVWNGRDDGSVSESSVVGVQMNGGTAFEVRSSISPKKSALICRPSEGGASFGGSVGSPSRVSFATNGVAGSGEGRNGAARPPSARRETSIEVQSQVSPKTTSMEIGGQPLRPFESSPGHSESGGDVWPQRGEFPSSYHNGYHNAVQSTSSGSHLEIAITDQLQQLKTLTQAARALEAELSQPLKPVRVSPLADGYVDAASYHRVCAALVELAEACTHHARGDQPLLSTAEKCLAAAGEHPGVGQARSRLHASMETTWNGAPFSVSRREDTPATSTPLSIHPVSAVRDDSRLAGFLSSSASQDPRVGWRDMLEERSTRLRSARTPSPGSVSRRHYATATLARSASGKEPGGALELLRSLRSAQRSPKFLTPSS